MTNITDTPFPAGHAFIATRGHDTQYRITGVASVVKSGRQTYRYTVQVFALFNDGTWHLVNPRGSFYHGEILESLAVGRWEEFTEGG